MKLVVLPLSAFAIPVPRTGSIDAYSGSGRAAAEGRRIHQRVQKKRKKEDAAYEAEVAVSFPFDRDGFRFRIDGRMDGIFRGELPVIEEIKSTFSIRDLSRRLSAGSLDHPYTLQLLTYGYIHWREHGVVPRLAFHLVSTRSGESGDIEITLDIGQYEEWLDLRLTELAEEARQAEKRAARRRKLQTSLTFPFDTPRPGQLELMETVEEGMRLHRPMLLQAATGLGKTVGVLYPVLREALGRGQTVVYVTPKNSQHALAEEAVARLRERGSAVRSLSITAKGKICFKNEPLCNPEYCEFARDYYGKLHRHGIRDVLARKRSLKARTFRKLGETYEVCPFELQIDAAPDADVVICDYNYVFAPRSALGRVTSLPVDQEGKPNLVIDEAHNLPSRGMDYYSPALSSYVLENLREPLRTIPQRFRKEAEELLDGCLRTVAACRGDATRAARIDPPVEAFLGQESGLAAFLSRYLDSDAEVQSEDPVLRLCFYWSDFTEALQYAADPEQDAFFTTWHPSGGGTVKITCCDAGPLLRDCYADYQQVAAFSATLKPFNYYTTLSGLDPKTVLTAEFGSPFPQENRKLLIIPQVSTKYSERERNYGRIADAIHRIVSVRHGNYCVFLPSFDFLDRVFALFSTPAGFSALRQERAMKKGDVDCVLTALRENGTPTVVFAVQGGSFAEGIDYAGDMLIGAFVVGPPLPTFDLEREEMRGYYQRRYGAGFDYAYTIPAMAKAVQAAGRVIRSETDRGLVVLMDGRFTETGYSAAMPADWFATDVSELVSTQIIADVRGFWMGI